jgi:hypothetical protein
MVQTVAFVFIKHASSVLLKVPLKGLFWPFFHPLKKFGRFLLELSLV